MADLKPPEAALLTDAKIKACYKKHIYLLGSLDEMYHSQQRIRRAVADAASAKMWKHVLVVLEERSLEAYKNGFGQAEYDTHAHYQPAVAALRELVAKVEGAENDGDLSMGKRFGEALAAAQAVLAAQQASPQSHLGWPPEDTKDYDFRIESSDAGSFMDPPGIIGREETQCPP